MVHVTYCGWQIATHDRLFYGHPRPPKFLSKNPALPRHPPRNPPAPWSVKCSGRAAPRSGAARHGAAFRNQASFHRFFAIPDRAFPPFSRIDLGGDVTGNGISKLVFTILSAVAENERDRIRERVRDAKRHRLTAFLQRRQTALRMVTTVSFGAAINSSFGFHNKRDKTSGTGRLARPLRRRIAP